MLFTSFSEKNQAAHAFSKVESLRKSNEISKNLQVPTATDNKIRAAWRSQSKGVKAKNNFRPEIPPKEQIPHKSSQITAIKNSMPAKKNFELERSNLALRREAMSSSKYCHHPDSKSGVKHRELRSSLSEFPYESSKSRLKKLEKEGNQLLFEDSKFICSISQAMKITLTFKIREASKEEIAFLARGHTTKEPNTLINCKALATAISMITLSTSIDPSLKQ
jgi:hypothetical protein